VTHDLADEAPAPQIREVPRLRALCSVYQGPCSGIGAALESLNRSAVLGGVGPSGPAVVDWAELPGEGGEHASIQLQLLVPVRGTPPEQEVWEFAGTGDQGKPFLVDLGPMRVASIHYSGPSGSLLYSAHLRLFAWMDAHAHPRAGTRHLRAYLAGLPGGEAISVELRVPLIGGGAPRPPV
jgi:hypothetical protein